MRPLREKYEADGRNISELGDVKVLNLSSWPDSHRALECCIVALKRAAELLRVGSFGFA